MVEIVKAIQTGFKVVIDRTGGQCEMTVEDEKGDPIVRVVGTSDEDARKKLEEHGYVVQGVTSTGSGQNPKHWPFPDMGCMGDDMGMNC